ncbi:MAG: crotonase/enoyl-CoA hydratase family protein [Pseudomonadota bacterium]
MSAMEGLDINVRDGAHIIRFVRPEKKNALKSAMYTAIREAIVAADDNADVTAHVFIGSDGVFTAGNDIGEFADRASGNTALSDHVQSFIRHLPNVRKPMIAAVDGLAVGIGTTLLLHCDLVYATPTASLRTPFVNLGLVPEAGSSLLAPRLMGPRLAFELLVLGKPFDADKAVTAGIVNEIVDAEMLEATALAAVAQLAAKPPEAAALSRAMIRGQPAEVVERIDEEIRIFAERLSSPEAVEAFTAFFDKRAPDFAKLRKSS